MTFRPPTAVLAVSSPTVSFPGDKPFGGAVLILSMSAVLALLSPDIPLWLGDTCISVVTLTTAEVASGHFSSSLLLKDVTGDAVDDLVMSAPLGFVGKLFVVDGSALPLSGEYNIELLPAGVLASLSGWNYNRFGSSIHVLLDPSDNSSSSMAEPLVCSYAAGATTTMFRYSGPVFLHRLRTAAAAPGPNKFVLSTTGYLFLS